MTDTFVYTMVESEGIDLDIIERGWTFQQSISGILGMLLVLDRDRRVIFTGTELEFVVKYSLPECLIMFNAAESIAVTHFPSVDKTLELSTSVLCCGKAFSPDI